MNDFCVLSFYNAFLFAEHQGKMPVELKCENKFISELYLQSEMADVHFLLLATGDETVKVPAHTLVLAAASPVFKAMFFGKVKEKDVVKISTTNSIAFKEFLQIFYLPVLTVTMENIDEVTRLADKYQVMDRLKTSLTVKEGNQKIFTNRQVMPNIQWNKNAVLTCKLEQDKYCVSMKNTESTWFSTDQSVVLGIIGIGGGCINKANIVLTMSIVEYNQQTFPLTSDWKVLYETIVEFSADAPHILLSQPVVIHPLKMYEIRFEGTNNLNYYHLPISKTKRRLDGDIVIKFYENPNDEQSEYRGLVSSLSFNRF